MKLTKLLIPSLSLVAIAPTSMLLTSCAKNTSPFKFDIDFAKLNEPNNFVETMQQGSFLYYVYEPFTFKMSYSDKSKSFANTDEVKIDSHLYHVRCKMISGNFYLDLAEGDITNSHCEEDGSWVFDLSPRLTNIDSSKGELSPGDHLTWSLKYDLEFEVNDQECGTIEDGKITGFLQWKE